MQKRNKRNANSVNLLRRGLLLGGAAATLSTLVDFAPAVAQDQPGNTDSTVPPDPVCERPKPQADSYQASSPETMLAFRNHGFLFEVANEPITPLGLHYLLIHYDVPQLTSETYTVAIGGRVRNPRKLSLGEIKSRQAVNSLHTMECAGTGRHLLSPRPVYVPFYKNPIGTYKYTGTPLAPILQEAGILDDAVEVVFTGWDIGVDLGVEHAFERSMPIADALRPEVMLAWNANCQPLLPQHGFPLRLVVPSWYGMASVKWLRAITVINSKFQGFAQFIEYRYKQKEDEPGDPVREKRVNSVLKHPGIPDLGSRYRFVAPGTYTIEGKAWSGFGPVTRVEFSSNDGQTWQPAPVQRISSDPYAWVSWSAQWTAKNGEYTLRCRAFDTAGNAQPLEANDVFNLQGMGINVADRVHVIVKDDVGSSGQSVPSIPRADLSCAKPPPGPDASSMNLAARDQTMPALVINQNRNFDNDCELEIR